ncbi:hypothetical protein D3C87_1651490 [compost metagenome]
MKRLLFNGWLGLQVEYLCIRVQPAKTRRLLRLPLECAQQHGVGHHVEGARQAEIFRILVRKGKDELRLRLTGIFNCVNHA